MHSSQSVFSHIDWCLTSPNLLNTNHAPDWSKTVRFENSHDILQNLKSYALENHSSSSSNRLGIIFEECFQACLNLAKTPYPPYSPRFGSIYNRLQINHNDNKKTLGEFDFVYQDLIDRNWIHTETAVKFYLGLGADLSKMESWIGPNKNDRLDLKYHHLFNSQLNLSKCREARELLTKMGIDGSKISRQYWVKGILFAPFHNNTATLPREINPDCTLGYWLTLSDFSKIQRTESPVSWSILDRSDWIVHDKHAAASKENSFANCSEEFNNLIDAIQRQFTLYKRPVQILADYTGDKLQCCRYFIVPDTWPETT